MKTHSLNFWYAVFAVIFAILAAALAGCAPSPSATSPTGVAATPVPTQPTALATVLVPATPTQSAAATITAVALATAVSTQSATPAPTATTTVLVNASPPELKFRLIQQFRPIFFCDRDLYPVAHDVSDAEIAARVAQLRHDSQVFAAIVQHLGLQGTTNPSPDQNRLIDAARKQLEAVQLVPAGEQFSFDLRTTGADRRGMQITGTITADGVVRITSQQPSFNTCPICLAGSTLIDTPQGAVQVRALMVGMPIWTANAFGQRELGVVLKTVRRPVPADVLMVQLVLDDGRALLLSPAHPTFDGRYAGDLRIGDSLDGARVASTQLVPFGQDATYDLLASGATGAYWANGVLMGSTLAPK